MKQIGMKQIFNSVSIVVVALLSLCQVRLAFAQLNTFEAGQPIRASEMNHNFEVVQEQIEEISTSSITDAGCSATQQENSVLIECSDGTSGVIAGAGTVIAFPEGQVGAIEPSVYNTGEVVVVDSSNVVLGLATDRERNNPSAYFISLDVVLAQGAIEAVLYNDAATGSVRLLSYNAGAPNSATSLVFISDDCSGDAWIKPSSDWAPLGFAAHNGSFFVIPAGQDVERLLFKSRLLSEQVNYNAEYYPAGECSMGEFVYDAYKAAPYTPAPEILNAAYPVRLEQLP